MFIAFLSICMLFINLPTSTVSRAVPDLRYQSEGIVYISPNEIPDDFSFPKATELVIDGVRVPEWDESMFSRLNNTKYLTLVDGIVPMVTFQSRHLLSLSVLQCELSSVYIWPEKNSVLEMLRLSRNRLSRLPPNLRFLVRLTSLDLSQNELEQVNLGELEGMKQLKTLDLSVNRITTIDASATLRLTKLKNLAVNFNLMERFDAFPRAFPVLDTVRLMGNLWTCEWVDLARKSIIRRRITTFGVDFGCSEQRQGGLCCYGNPKSTTEAEFLKEGSLLKEIQVLVNDIAGNPIKTSGSQSVLELLTRNEGVHDDKILVGVKLDQTQVFI